MPHVPFYDNTNQVTEWAPVLHPIEVSSLNCLKSSLTLSYALKSMEMIGGGNPAIKHGENSP